jgi:heme/copper-type cytochrome/quinol oxidase subunit 3
MQNYNESLLYLFFTEIMAYTFIILQIEEYIELSFTISDNIYSSLFFLLTGFHGMHVLVGTIFIIITHERLFFIHFSTNKNIGFGLALIY